MAIIHAYFDESGTQADSHTVFAGAVASDSEWTEMSKRWQDVLDLAGIPALHMVDAIRFNGHFTSWRGREHERDALLIRLADIFESSIQRIFIAPEPSAIFRSLPETQRKRFKKTNYVLFESCVKSLLALADLKSTDILHLYFDSSEDHSLECLKLYLKMRVRDPFLKSKCAMLGFGQDELLPPLQAVDMLAYCYYLDIIRDTRKLKPIIDEILVVLKRGTPGKSANLEYDVTNSQAELGSGKLDVR